MTTREIEFGVKVTLRVPDGTHEDAARRALECIRSLENKDTSFHPTHHAIQVDFYIPDSKNIDPVVETLESHGFADVVGSDPLFVVSTSMGYDAENKQDALDQLKANLFMDDVEWYMDSENKTTGDKAIVDSADLERGLGIMK